MAYIGNNTSIQQYAPTISYFNGTGSQTVFTLPISVASAAQILVFIENVPQNPASAFTVSGTTLTFTSAPPSGTSNIWVEYTSLQTNTIAPSNGTVGWNQLTSGVQQDLGISFKNRIINGAMVIDQRNAGASVTQSSTGLYVTDRFVISGTVTSKFTAQQNAGSVTPPAGFTNYLGATSTSAYTVGATDTFNIQQKIEGYNIADLGWGTANAKTVTLSFLVRSSLTGTFGGSLRNSAADRCYPFSYTISVANTWEQKSIAIVGDTTGTWLTTNGIGITLLFSLGTGSTYSNTAGSWAAGTYNSVIGATSVVGTNGATFYITGVQLEAGTQATAFDYRSYGTELALCQRYYGFVNTTVPSIASTYVAYIPYKSTMRASPTVVAGAGLSAFTTDPNMVACQQTTTTNNQLVTFSAEL